jgi:hypothetical protein
VESKPEENRELREAVRLVSTFVFVLVLNKINASCGAYVLSQKLLEGFGRNLIFLSV